MDAMEADDETVETITSRAHFLSIDGKGSEKSQISAFSSTNNISSTFELKCGAGFDVKPLTLVRLLCAPIYEEIICGFLHFLMRRS